eukprot:CAMPEP_0185558574 /NCGR_PEP_ID=MMETSP1381-20130426/52557_1 /TAXON_ID=298111 /ORGANISM="Pavlova sp., Strain CCMP459" /LENGTH=182 /DNA_ID=CAMNT_0028172133 /DNA_START=242 /DNA_END=788 /DNA_ORIENTATION=+
MACAPALFHAQGRLQHAEAQRRPNQAPAYVNVRGKNYGEFNSHESCASIKHRVNSHVVGNFSVDAHLSAMTVREPLSRTLSGLNELLYHHQQHLKRWLVKESGGMANSSVQALLALPLDPGGLRRRFEANHDLLAAARVYVLEAMHAGYTNIHVSSQAADVVAAERAGLLDALLHTESTADW